MDFTVQDLKELLSESRLYSQEEVDAAHSRWRSESVNGKDNPDEFSRWLIANKLVTEYQASLLQRGHTDGFFLNEYKILERVGRGKMAGVYKAIHTTGNIVAIKVLPPSRARDPKLLARFQREARLAMRLDHPNVMRTYEMGAAGGTHYFVMEHLEGESLQAVLQRRKRLPHEEATRLILQALAGLGHLQERGVIHRDLKPSNMMLVPGHKPGEPDLTTSATLKILDLGLGRLVGEEVAPEQQEDIQLTTPGTVMGTPDYLAPEQARDARSADIRADIYSLGCMYFHLVTGHTPFPDKNFLRQMVRHATEDRPRLRAYVENLPEALQTVIDTMMAKDPAQRYATPQKAIEALEAMQGQALAPIILQVPEETQLYLKWLRDEGKPDPAAVQTVLAMGALTPGSNPNDVAAPTPLGSSRPRIPPRSKPAASPTPRPTKGKSNGDLSAPVRRPNRKRPAPADAFDVDLVPAPTPVKTEEPAATFELSRRDLFMFVFGASSAIGAVLIGYLLHLLFRVEADANQESPGQ